MFSDEWYKLQDPGIHYTGMSELGDEIRINAEKRRWECVDCSKESMNQESNQRRKCKNQLWKVDINESCLIPSYSIILFQVLLHLELGEEDQKVEVSMES